MQTVATIVVASLTCGKDGRVSQSQHTGSRPAPTTPFDYSKHQNNSISRLNVKKQNNNSPIGSVKHSNTDVTNLSNRKLFIRLHAFHLCEASPLLETLQPCMIIKLMFCSSDLLFGWNANVSLCLRGFNWKHIKKCC